MRSVARSMGISFLPGPTFRSFSWVSAIAVCAALSTGCNFSFGKAKSADDAKSGEAPAEAQAEAADSKKSATPATKKPQKPGEQPAAAAEASSTEPGAESQQSADDSTAQGAEAAPVAVAPEPAQKPRPERPAMSAQVEKAYLDGQKAFNNGDLAGARTQFEAAGREGRDAYQVHYALATVRERLGDSTGAAKSYVHAYNAVPDYEEAIVAHSLLMARQGNYDQANSLLQKKISDWGASAALLTAQSEVKSMQGQSGDAQELAQKALKLNPNYKPAMVALARDHYRARRIDLALYALTGILDGYGEGNPARDKDNAEAHMLRGLIYAERGLRGPAMTEMEAALKQRGDLVEAHLVLANYMMEAGNASGARPHLESAVRYDNKNIAAHLQLGDAYRLLGLPDRARQELEWVLVADPNQAAAQYNLGLLFLLTDKMSGMTEMQTLEKAIEHLEAYKARAVRGGPDDVDDLITRAKTKQAVLKAKQDAAAGG